MALGLSLSSNVMANQSQTEMKTLYGWHMMTRAERSHFRYLLQFQKTAEDRENFLILHKRKMQIRASYLNIPVPKQAVSSQNMRRASMSGLVQR
ncbi:MAG: hypothetical protein OEX12_03065 [Gammaproteobacteria bacterium]|nr:hypothetical protein [Gammaproteobacteria bacterium]